MSAADPSAAADAATASAASAAAEARRVVAAEVARTVAATAALRREHDQWQAAATQRRTARERAARTGSLGPVARELQERVDAGSTTWDAILDGRDLSDSARTARAHVQRRVTELGRERAAGDPSG